MRYPEGSHILTAKQQDWAYSKWCDGYTEQEIADALCCSNKTIMRIFKKKEKVKKPLYYDFVRDCGS